MDNLEEYVDRVLHVTLICASGSKVVVVVVFSVRLSVPNVLLCVLRCLSVLS